MENKEHATEPAESPRPALETVEELRAKVQRLQLVLDGQFDRETVLKYLHYYEGGPLTMSMSVPDFVRRFFAQLFVIAMDDAENFQVGSFQWKAQDYEMTIRRINGKSTAQVLGELRAEVAALKEQINTPEREAESDQD